MRRPRLRIRPLRFWLGLCCTIVCTFMLLPGLYSQPQETKSTFGAAAIPKEPQLSPALKELFQNAWGLHNKHQNDAAREGFEHALTLAREEKNAWGEGEAHRCLGFLAYTAANYPAAQGEYEQALKLFDSIPSPASAARVYYHLGAVANLTGKRTEAVELYRKALSQYEALGDLRNQANVLENLRLVETVPQEDRRMYTERGLILARKIGDKSLEGAFLHGIGDGLFTAGDYPGAIEKLKEAASCFEEAGNRSGLAYLWTSMGRIYRTHGVYDEAIAYFQKGLLIQQEIGDKLGVIQSLNAMAFSYQLLGRDAEAVERYKRALVLARETGSPRVIGFIAGNFGTYLEGKKDCKGAIDLLEEAIRLDPSASYLGQRYSGLGLCYLQTTQNDRALEAEERAVSLLRSGGYTELLIAALQNRAIAREKLQQLSGALADIEDALRGSEQFRAHILPTDYLKQGFAETAQNLFADAIRIHEELGQHKEAMVVAEEARARAFLDLLASRGLEQKTPQSTSTPLTAANDVPGNSSSVSQAPSSAKKEEPIALTTRGGSAPLKLSDTQGAPILPSPSSAVPPTFEELLATAKRLDSTLLSYWVEQDTTFIWVLRPDGVVRSERAAITSEQLSKLIRQTSSAEEEPRAEPALEAKAQTEAPVALATARGPQTLRLRGGGELVLGGKTAQSWRELYKLLVLPVQDSLPPRGSHLTIVPQGAR